MSEPVHDQATPAGGHGHGSRSEEDVVPTGRLILIGLAALFVFFLGSLAAVLYLRARVEAHGPVTIPAEVGSSKIGLVEQQLFDLAVRAERQRTRQRQRLDSYGWVDRRAGVARIPIEEAMRLVASGARPGPATQTPPPGGQP